MYLSGLILAGGLIGSLLHIAVGAFSHPHHSVSYLAAKGFLNGAFYLMIWAWSIALVICVMQAYRANQKRAEGQPKT